MSELFSTGCLNNRVREVLHRSPCRGDKFWNKTKKRNRSGVVRSSGRSEDEWIKAPVPHLRIVTGGLWRAVEQRFESCDNVPSAPMAGNCSADRPAREPDTR